jgi:hypothetical protein
MNADAPIATVAEVPRKKGRPFCVVLAWIVPALVVWVAFAIGRTIRGGWFPGLDWDFAGLFAGGMCALGLSIAAIRRREYWFWLVLPPLVYGVWALCYFGIHPVDTWELLWHLTPPGYNYGGA